ncbi:MAG TPA: DMT family transporter [Bacteroidota bacterium]|jgi:drug/metabolite transporter (DMT)-like permease|nr:DMT family transporter [Bacteroidota bacterium]
MTDHDKRHEYRAEALLFVVVVIWAANYPLAKWAISGLNTYIFNAIRFIVASVVVAIMFGARSKWVPLRPGDLVKLIGAGLVANVLYQLVFILGLSMTTAGNSAILLSTSPLWTVFFNAVLHKERVMKNMWVGMAISLLGVSLIILGSGKRIELDGNALLGDIITLTAAMVWGLNTNLQKPLLAKYSVLQVTFVMMTVGGVGLTLSGIPSMASLDWGSIRWTYYAAAIVSGALSIGISNAIWSNGVKRLGPGRTANFNNLVPVLAVVLSAFFLKEEVTAFQIFGIGITMLGVWLARRTKLPFGSSAELAA